MCGALDEEDLQGLLGGWSRGGGAGEDERAGADVIVFEFRFLVCVERGEVD